MLKLMGMKKIQIYVQNCYLSKHDISIQADFQEGVIRIQAPTLTKSSTAIQLDDHTTAGSIVSKFKVIQGSQTWDPR